MKRIPIEYGMEYEMSDAIPIDKTDFIRVSEEIVIEFKRLVNNYKEYKETLATIESLKQAECSLAADLLVRRIVSEKIDNLIEAKKHYERIRDNALDMSKFSFSRDEGRAIYKIRLISGINVTFQDVFGSNAEIGIIKQVAWMGQGMGIRADSDEYEIHIVNKTKGIEVAIRYSR